MKETRTRRADRRLVPKGHESRLSRPFPCRQIPQGCTRVVWLDVPAPPGRWRQRNDRRQERLDVVRLVLGCSGGRRPRQARRITTWTNGCWEAVRYGAAVFMLAIIDRGALVR